MSYSNESSDQKYDQASTNEALFAVAESGDVAAVRVLLDNGANINAVNSYNETALMHAASQGHANVVKLLLDNCADVDVNAVDIYGAKALMYAAHNGYKNIVELLLDHNKDIDFVDFRGRTALMYAAQNKYKNIVELLLAKGANVNVIDPSGMTALMYAVEKGNADIVKVLLRNGAKVTPELQGKTIIEAAIKSIAEERANHRLVCHGINQALTAKSGAYVIPADSKEFNLNLMRLLPPELANRIATMSADSYIHYDLANRIAQEEINPQEDEKQPDSTVSSASATSAENEAGVCSELQQQGGLGSGAASSPAVNNPSRASI
mgnify:CR=1 FL=1